MSENTLNVVFDYQLTEENEQIMKNLNECHKKIEFLESYRKFLIKFSEECLCSQTSVIKCLVKSLETNYNKTFASTQVSDGQFIDIQTNQQNSDQNCDVIEELVLRTEESNEKITNNDCSQETDQQSGDNNNQSDDNFVLVFNKTNNSIVKKSRDNVDTNIEFVINKFIVKNTEEPITEEVVETIAESSTQVLAQKSNETENQMTTETTTQPLVDMNSQFVDMGETFPLSGVSGKVLLVLPTASIDAKTIRKRQTTKSSLNSDSKRKSKSKIQKALSEDSNDGHNSNSLSEEYKENNRIFHSLLNDLKIGKIDTFYDKNYNLIKVSLQKDKKVIFNCTHEGCQFVSQTIHSARRHAQRHNKCKSFVCHLCDKSFVLRAYLSQHLQLVHNTKGKPLLRCEFPDCQFRSITKSQLKTHYFSHSEEKTVKCEHNGCDSYFKSINQMKAHMKLHNEVREYACEWTACEARFKSKAYLKRHSETHTGEGISTTKLKEVLQTGNYISTVDKNNKMFSVIRQQVINKTKGKVEIGAQMGFKCNHSSCQFATIFKHLMAQHVSTHLFGKTFECNLCDKKFGLDKYLIQHKKTVHNVNNNPIICCPVADCQYKTTYRLGLRIHSLTHQTERPFKCDFNGCDKRFKTQVLLRWHKNNRHLKAKPYVCEYVGCHSAFEVREQLKRHIRCHTKPFQCHYDNCSKSYKKKQDLNRHLREKH